MAQLELDPQIRDWVLLPLTLVMILIGVLRHFIAKAMKSEPKVEAKAIKEGQIVLRARALRAGGGAIPERSFDMRRHYFCNEVRGSPLKGSYETVGKACRDVSYTACYSFKTPFYAPLSHNRAVLPARWFGTSPSRNSIRARLRRPHLASRVPEGSMVPA